ncbi:ATP-binding protein [Thiovibrio sp. JS02]
MASPKDLPPGTEKNRGADILAHQEKFLKILDSLDAIVYVADMQSHELLFVNRYARRLFGEIEGAICWQTLQQGQTGPCPFCSNDKLLDENGRPTGEYGWDLRNTRNNHWYRMADRAIEWVDGRMVRLEIATDITERKLGQEALARRSRALEILSKGNAALIRAKTEDDLLHEICRLLVEVGGYGLAWVGYAMHDPEKSVKPVAQYGKEGGFLACLRATWADALENGDPAGRAISSGRRVLMPETAASAAGCAWHREALNHGFGAALSLPVPAGASIVGALTIHAAGASVFDEEEILLLEELANNLAYGIQALRARQEAECSRAELTRSNEQLALLLDSLPIIPFTRIPDRDFSFTYMSNVVESITGHRPERFLTTPRFWVEHLHPEDRMRAVVDLESLRTQEARKCECRFLAADGTYRWFASNLRAVRHADGSLRHIVGTWQDVSDEKKLQLESEQRLRQVIQADKLASLGQVVAGVAHEINNPNSFITYNVPLLAESWETFAPVIMEFSQNHPGVKAGNITFAEMAEEMGEIIAAIKTGSDRINTIVAKLKDFSRLDEAAPSKLVDINKVINDSLTIVGAQARKLVGSISVDLAEDLPQFYGHFQKLEQVVANLIMNAAQAVESKETGAISIRSRYVTRLHAVLVEVTDNGQGIAPEEASHIFDPFFTTKRAQGGTGLGLSVSYGLVQEHNGRIAVLSRPGLGTRFTVFLPVERRTSPLELRPTILCVDDDPTVLGLLKSFFVDVRKMPVEFMKDGTEVLGFLEEHPEIDMVLSDISMPGLSGWQLLRKIKEKFPLLPVVLISGDPVEARQAAGQHCQADHFMAKPLDLPKLISVINTIGRQRL